MNEILYNNIFFTIIIILLSYMVYASLKFIYDTKGYKYLHIYYDSNGEIINE